MEGPKILDFGGNVGTFLVGAGSQVDHDDYWCLDLNQDVVEQGQRTYPRAHFVHYNRYSSQYNPNGVRYLPVPDSGVKLDIILAFSVFTHIDQSEMLELVGSLRSMLAPEGVLAFTFWDPHSGYVAVRSHTLRSSRCDVTSSLVLTRMQSNEPGGGFLSTTTCTWNRATSSAIRPGRVNPWNLTARSLPPTIWPRYSRTRRCIHR